VTNGDSFSGHSTVAVVDRHCFEVRAQLYLKVESEGVCAQVVHQGRTVHVRSTAEVELLVDRILGAFGNRSDPDLGHMITVTYRRHRPVRAEQRIAHRVCAAVFTNANSSSHAQSG
jgi:hypothetical protein